jgi:hypothetical protein
MTSVAYDFAMLAKLQSYFQPGAIHSSGSNMGGNTEHMRLRCDGMTITQAQAVIDAMVATENLQPLIGTAKDNVIVSIFQASPPAQYSVSFFVQHHLQEGFTSFLVVAQSGY